MPTDVVRELPLNCTISQCARWIETSDFNEIAKERVVPPSQGSIDQLLFQLSAGRISATGLLDGSERRPLSPEEWHDYTIFVLQGSQAIHKVFPSVVIQENFSHMIAVRSRGMFPASTVNDQCGFALALLPSRKLHFHRFVKQVLIPIDDLLRAFPNPHELNGLKLSQQVRVLMGRYNLGPPHKSAALAAKAIIGLLKGANQPFQSEDAVRKAVRREFLSRSKISKKTAVSVK